MGGLLLSRSVRHLLEEVCHRSLWEYAIFWKLDRRSCMVLTWEEGYSKNSNPSNFLENTELDELYNHPSSEMDARNIQAQHPIGLEISRESSNLYSLGNGIIGNVAVTGKHLWLSFSGLNSKVLEECPDEWRRQFAVGIKTILLVPVGSDGVVQLGSFQSFEEDMSVVAGIKDLFHSYNNSGGFADITPNEDDLRIYTEPHLWLTEEMEGGTEQVSGNKETTGYCSISLPPGNNGNAFMQGNVQDTPGMNMHLPYGSSWDDMCDFFSMGPTEEPFYQDGCFGMNDSFFNLTSENLLFTFSQSNSDDANLLAGLSAFSDSCNSDVDGPYGSQHNADEIDQPIITEVLEIAPNEINADASDIFNGSPQADIIYEHDNHVSYTTLEDHWLHSPPNLDTSAPEVDKVSVNEADLKRVLDSLVAVLDNASGEGVVPNTSTMERFSSDYPGDHISCSQMQRKCQSDESSMDGLVSKGHANNPGLSPGSVLVHTSPTGSSSSLNDITLIDEEKPHQTKVGADRNKPKKSVSVGKKRSRPDESQRPRPRDRQLIQDRVKELRDLVPNTKKCSIDALLDRTIKHMMFLRSVSSQAEKLRKCSRLKVLGPDREPLEFEDENYGLTWAYELDSQPEACPIVVKDLDQQGHLLVEMLCMEYADFLEIAQVMRRLRLTILKGAMESRSEKLWAHFIVEATKGFNRMEILWPLMQLLQKNHIPLTSRF